MDERETNDRLSELAARLERIEVFLGLPRRVSPRAPATPPKAEAPPISPSVAPPAAPEPAHVVPEREPPVIDVAPVPERLRPRVPEHLTANTGRAARESPAGANVAAQPLASAADAARPSKRAMSLEVLIGQRWMAWVGAVVSVVGVAFLLKLAYDVGLWGRLPAVAKCLLTGGFGAALVVAGEVTLRRIGRLAAVGLFGAGLGTLYLTAYATFRYFALLPQTGAFGLMALVVLLGIGITLRGRLLSIGVLALLGGYLTPILLAEHLTFAAAQPLYLTGLLLIATVLSALLPQPFRVLRYVGLAMHVIVASIWLWYEGSGHWLLAMVFLTLWWVLVGAEALLAALREQSPRGNPTTTLLLTFWYVSVGCGVLSAAQPGARDWLGAFVGAVGAACAWTALVIGPGLTVLRGLPKRAAELMATTLWAQTGILIATAIGLQFRGPGESYGQSLGWMAMGIACIELGRRLPSRGVDVFGLIVGAAGVLRVWALDWPTSALQVTAWAWGPVTLTRWALLALVAAAATIAVSRRLNTTGQRECERFCRVLTFLAGVQWAIVCVVAASDLALTAGWLVAVGALLLTVRWPASHGHRPIALCLLVLAAGKWLVVDAYGGRLSPAWSASAAVPVFNWLTAVAALAAACMYLGWRTAPLVPAADRFGADAGREPGLGRRPRGQWLLVGGTLFVLVALSFQMEHVIARVEAAHVATAWRWNPMQLRVLWWAVLWGAGSLAAQSVGWRNVLGALRDLGMLLLVGAVGLWAGVGGFFWRVDAGVVLAPVGLNVQFGTGLLMVLIVGGAYFSMRRVTAAGGKPVAVEAQVTLLAAIGLFLFALSLEVDRLLAHLSVGRAPDAALWSPVQARLLWWTLLWGVGGLATLLVGRLRGLRVLYGSGVFAIGCCTTAWLLVDTLYWRIASGVAPCAVVLNPQFGVGLALLAIVAVAARVAWRPPPGADGWTPASWPVALAAVVLVALVGLWLGSLELDRFFAPEAQRVSNAAMARQTALSVFWGVYAIGLVAVGFWQRAALLRYFGLGLLAVALVKVFLVDLAHVQCMYRVLSLLAVGLLFIATSVAYAKLSARLLSSGGPQAARP